jgi:hypothetical protein
MKKMIRFLMILSLLPPAFPAMAVAADVVGTWKGTMSQGGQAVFSLKTEGDSITGTMLGLDGKEKPIRKGKLKGDEISFLVDSDWEGMPVTLQVKGTVSGREMRLRIDADNGYWGTDAVVRKQ